MRKIGLLSIAGILVCLSVKAQRADASGEKTAQSFYGEVGGPGIISFNYDQRFKGQAGFGFRVGMGGYGILNKGVFTVPLGINYLTGADNQYVEVGAGICSVSLSSGNSYFSNSSSTVIAYFNFGYRYQPAKKGLTYRLFLSPLVTAAGSTPFYGGASIGVKF